MGIPKTPSEGGSGGRRGHSGMEHWGYTDEVKKAAKQRRRLNDKSAVKQQSQELDRPQSDLDPPANNS